MLNVIVYFLLERKSSIHEKEKYLLSIII